MFSLHHPQIPRSRYDHTGDRLVEVLQSNNNLTRFTYDDSNQTSVVSEVLNSTTFKSTYTYDSDKKLTELQDALNYKVGYGYDGFGRLSSKTFKTSLGATLFTTSYTYTGYTELGVNYTSAQLASITNGSSTISYTYDANGNITAITQGSTVIAYVYDDLGQVVRENNARDNKTIIYDYDLAGNILSRTTYTYTTGSLDGLTPLSTLTYSYGNSVWKDQLTAFNGNAITYDDLGNPLSYNGMTFTWEKGRQLSGLSDTNLSASYTYNDAGIRTSKTVNNVTTTYQLSGDKVTAEITGNQIIYYTYDASGQVVTMNANGVEYYYVRNGQNDVIALVDNTGAIVVEYTYSTYGEVLTVTGSLASTIGALNPYRYRGYRYDNESGLYYLQSRYYNPVWGRFINADEPGIISSLSDDLLQTNIYSYGKNNPIKNIDPSGYWVIGPFGSEATIVIGFVGLFAAAYAMFSGVKSFLTLNSPKQIEYNLIYMIGAGMFVGLSTSFVLWLQTIISDYSVYIYAIIVGANIAMYSLAGGPIGGAIWSFIFGSLLSFAPDIKTSLKMINSGKNGKSYKLDIGWWRWKWLPV